MPEAGSAGGRKILIFTSTNSALQPCPLQPCLIAEDRRADTVWITCDKCNQDIHVYCDKTVRGKRGKDLPVEYFCPSCKKKRNVNV